MLSTLELHPWIWLGISQEYFGTISGNILNVIWWVHAGYMLRSQSKCTQNVIGEYIGGKIIQGPQFTQNVPTGFQVTLPPVFVSHFSSSTSLTRGGHVLKSPKESPSYAATQALHRTIHNPWIRRQPFSYDIR